MTNYLKRIHLVALLAAFAAGTVSAEIELTKGLTISGYVVGSTVSSTSDREAASLLGGAGEQLGIANHESDTATEVESYKVQAVGRYGRFSATASAFAYGAESGSGYDHAPVLLDAHVAGDLGGGYSITAGKFVSWLGYEAFDPVNRNQLTRASENLLSAEPPLLLYLRDENDEVIATWEINIADMVAETGLHIDPMFGAPVPNYHSGLKIESNQKNYSLGLAVLDSVYGPAYYRGDGDFDNGLGFEAYASYKGLKNLTLFAGLAYERQKIEHTSADDYGTDSTFRAKYLTADFWAEYTLGATTFAAEFCWARTSYDEQTANSGSTFTSVNKSYFWAVSAKHAFTAKWAVSGRISGTTADMGEGQLIIYEGALHSYRYTVAPSYAVCRNLDLVAEYSYTDYSNGLLDNAQFFGLQARLKF